MTATEKNQAEKYLDKAVFLDRDGVINEEMGFYINKPEDFRIIEGVIEALRLLRNNGYKLLIVTNQGGIAKGALTKEDMDMIHEKMFRMFKENDVWVDGLYYCPHHPEGTVPGLDIRCNCRKPMPGMIEQAIKEHRIDVSKSFMIGDTITDMKAGRAAGLGGVILVRTGHGMKYVDCGGFDFVEDNVYSAAKRIVGINESLL